jgi:formylmethanofuran dehydrogenase subunit D
VDGQFRLVTGRTLEQVQALHRGKRSEAYQQATGWVALCREDLARLGISPGDRVRVRTAGGQADLIARLGDLPQGLIFIPLGPVASQLAGADTGATGMPLLKGLVAEVEGL